MQFSKLILILTITSPGIRSSKVSYKDQNVTDFFNRTRGWIAGDAAFTIQLSDSKTLWLFGDTYLDNLNNDGSTSCLFQARNSMMLQKGNDWNPENAITVSGHVTSTQFSSIFKLEASEYDSWFWPWSGFQMNGSVFVYLSRFRATGPFDCRWCFESDQQDYWAKIQYPNSIGSPEIIPLENFGDIRFGNGFITDMPDGYIYSYGQTLNSGIMSNYVGRFSADDPLTKWQFWNGNSWDLNINSAVSVADMEFIVSVYFAKVKSKILMFSTELSLDCDQGKSIFVSISDQITGPFTKEKVIYTLEADDTLDSHYPFFYQVVAHPQFINSNNELLITYCINNYEPCVKACIDDRTWPKNYRPQGVRVPLKIIHPEL